MTHWATGIHAQRRGWQSLTHLQWLPAQSQTEYALKNKVWNGRTRFNALILPAEIARSRTSITGKEPLKAQYGEPFTLQATHSWALWHINWQKESSCSSTHLGFHQKHTQVWWRSPGVVAYAQGVDYLNWPTYGRELGTNEKMCSHRCGRCELSHSASVPSPSAQRKKQLNMLWAEL